MMKVGQQTDMSATPLVSVALPAYNSEHTLARTIESILAQETDFPVEVVVGEDGSKDGTFAVADHYRKQYPAVVRVLEREKNLGMSRNYYETFEACRAKYIAWLDSDDYWTDPEKLAIQVKAMEADATIAVICHAVRWVTPTGEVKRERYPELAPGRYGMEQIVRSNFLPSPSVMFRNGIHRELPEWYFDIAPMTDWPLYVVAAHTGDIVLLDRVMADYTLNATSFFWGKGDAFWYKRDGEFYEYMKQIVPQRFLRLARAEQGKRYESLAYYLRKQGDFVGSREAALKAVRAPELLDNVPSKMKTLLASVVRELEWRGRGQKEAKGEAS